MLPDTHCGLNADFQGRAWSLGRAIGGTVFLCEDEPGDFAVVHRCESEDPAIFGAEVEVGQLVAMQSNLDARMASCLLFGQRINPAELSLFERSWRASLLRRIAVRRAAAKCMEFGTGRGQYVAFTPGIRTPWRATFYDQAGISGHRGGRVLVDLLDELAREGYSEAAPGTLDVLGLR